MGPSKEDEGAISMIKLQGFFFFISLHTISNQIENFKEKRQERSFIECEL